MGGHLVLMGTSGPRTTRPKGTRGPTTSCPGGQLVLGPRVRGGNLIKGGTSCPVTTVNSTCTCTHCILPIQKDYQPSLSFFSPLNIMMMIMLVLSPGGGSMNTFHCCKAIQNFTVLPLNTIYTCACDERCFY